MIRHETDYAAWAGEQAALLRSGQFSDLDIEHIAEELENITGNERREIYRRLRILIAHLLKWQFQPDQRSNSWRATIKVQRTDIDDVLEESPSLKRELEASIRKAYPKARELAADETGLIEKDFPRVCPYTETEILDSHFWPD
ncbi:MAG: DUF29 domain-containing protein [Methylococcaceae bacterium]|nr:DUF29 domain-containing protein [Methylococcaceae bacterium]